MTVAFNPEAVVVDLAEAVQTGIAIHEHHTTPISKTWQSR
jgi:hypothetical protein